MITLCEMDAAFRRLKEYDPDLDIRLLSKDSTTMDEDEKTTFHIQTRVIRMALVARIADIGMFSSHALATLLAKLICDCYSQASFHRAGVARCRCGHGGCAYLDLRRTRGIPWSRTQTRDASHPVVGFGLQSPG